MGIGTRTAVTISLMSNAIALGLVYVLTTVFVNTLLKHQKTWLQGVIAFVASALLATCVYLLVYFMFGYLPMGHVGPDVLQRVYGLEERLAELQAISEAPPTARDRELQAPI